MIEQVLADKIKQYAPQNALEQENVLCELLQHFVLASLSKAGFFRTAQFHGGTCLRILHRLDRFSEDLDFVLKQADPQFEWRKYLAQVVRDCDHEGIGFELVDKSKLDSAVQKAFLKSDSIGHVILLDLPHSRHRNRKIKIKLEIDTRPPLGSIFETSYITFPNTSPLTTQTLESSFASKLHALLCRNYTKGRDWYDFVWYVDRGTQPNYLLLKNALEQQGPWAGKDPRITPQWIVQKLRDSVQQIVWKQAVEDVRRFLPSRRQKELENWNQSFFVFQCKQLELNLR